jgi:hypothetical protein
VPDPGLAVETHENWLEQHRYLNICKNHVSIKTNHRASCLIPLRIFVGSGDHKLS